ncbi:MAG: hypothetical protein GY869_24430, partial [Planctomycetes bacterium]|nr:hypothetical protein [Planctomycetota bacterium]
LHKDDLGLVTHHADSYMTGELPKSGSYYLHLLDAQNHGGPDCGYRLRLTHLRPDFSLRITPSSLNLNAGSNIPMDIFALRKDNFEGSIELFLTDAPAAFKIYGGRIPAGQNHVRITLKVPPNMANQIVALNISGQAKINGQTINHLAVPADDMMQAFLYRHLVPAQELLVAIKNTNRRLSNIVPVNNKPVKIPRGGSVQVRFSNKTLRRQLLQNIKLVLNNPPDGITLQNVTFVRGGFTLQLYANKDISPREFKGNLIVEAFTEITPRPQAGRPTQQKRSVSLGYLPAIPIESIIDGI